MWHKAIVVVREWINQEAWIPNYSGRRFAKLAIALVHSTYTAYLIHSKHMDYSIYNTYNHGTSILSVIAVSCKGIPRSLRGKTNAPYRCVHLLHGNKREQLYRLDLYLYHNLICWSSSESRLTRVRLI